MKNNKPSHLMPQNKTLPTGSMYSFSNPSNFAKSRTQTVTPNMMRSPPSGLNSGSVIHQLNPDVGRYQLNQGDFSKQRNMQNLALGGVSRSSGSSQVRQQKKEFVSMQQALGFLNFINMNQQQAFRLPTIPLQQIQLHSQNRSRQASQQKGRQAHKRHPSQTPPPQRQGDHLESQNSNKLKLQQLQDSDDDDNQLSQTKKKLNKNRAIKRIIQTAYQLLQKNYHYASVQNQVSQEQRSTSTQFNIYLKQYNRIIEQINSKESEEIQTSNLLYDRNQEELQEVFQYTVMDDFRERLSTFFTKERLGKDNVDLMIKAFRDTLVSLKLNQLKVEYFDSQQPPKIIKMSEIQNVEYYTHPYIFIALTINKDKTKSKEQLYLKFSSEENQDKWDRALYCCFMSRKMTKKQKLFQIQFPVEDVMKKQKAENKKQDQIYEVNEDHPLIDKLYRSREPGRSPTTNSVALTIQNNEDINMLSDRPEYMNLAKNRTEQRIPIQEDVRRVNTVMAPNQNQSPFKGIEMNTNVKKPSSRHDALENDHNAFDQPEEDSKLSKKSTFNLNNSPTVSNNEIHPRANTLPQTSENNPPTTSYSNPFMKLLKIAQEQPSIKYQEPKPQVPQMPQHIEPNFEAQKKLQEQRLQQKLNKLKRIREIEKKNVRGIVCQKEKFFMNKEKIVFFYDETLLNSSRRVPGYKGEQENLQQVKGLTSEQLQSTKFLEYWDYDYKKDEKVERKQIAVGNILECQIIPSVLGQTTTSVVVGYNWVAGENKVEKKELGKVEKKELGKVERKELRLIFANPISGGFTSGVSTSGNLSKAEELCEWIRLVKAV